MTVEQLSKALEYASKSAIENMFMRNEYLSDARFSVVTTLVSADKKNYQTCLFVEYGIKYFTTNRAV